MDRDIRRTMYLRDKLSTLNYPEFYIGFMCGLVRAGYKGEMLSDVVCNIITSEEYLNL